MTRTTTITISTTIAVIAVATLVLAAAAGPAAAASDDSFFGNLVKPGDQGADGIASDVAVEVAGLTGQAARLQATINVPFIGSSTSTSVENATAYAEAATATFNSNNKTLVAIANANSDASADYDVWAVYFHDRSGGNVTRYVVADVVDGDYQNTRMLTPSEFGALNRTRDHYLSLDWYASRNADEELQAFADTFGDTHNISRSYAAKLYAQYGSGVESDVLGGRL